MMDNLTMNTLYFGMTANEILSLSAKVKAAEGLVEALETIATESHPELWQVEVAIKALSAYDKLSENK